MTNWIKYINNNSLFIEEFIDNNLLETDWNFVSQCVKLSVKQMEKYSKFLNWKLIFKYRILTPEVINMFRKYEPYSGYIEECQKQL